MPVEIASVSYSKPGEPPPYSAANVDTDEGTSEVHGDSQPSVNTAPPDTTPDPPPGSDAATTESDTAPATKASDDE